jgi:solute carrier family 25 protein 16
MSTNKVEDKKTGVYKNFLSGVTINNITQ